MANMVAQAPDNNQGPWANLENYLRSLLPANELYIVSGPAGMGGTGSNGGVTNTVANGHVTVPASTWKCALVLPKASGNDLARVTASTRTICVIMPNIQGIRNDDWHIYLKSVDQVEALSGFNLFSNVPAAIQNAIEASAVNPYKLLAFTRILACIVVLPLLTLVTDFCGVFAGWIAETLADPISLHHFLDKGLAVVSFSDFLAPTFRTCVFGLIIGLVACFQGMRTRGGTEGVGRSATSSVVLSSLLVILADVLLVKLILIFFP